MRRKPNHPSKAASIVSRENGWELSLSIGLVNQKFVFGDKDVQDAKAALNAFIDASYEEVRDDSSND